jgi:hypothetical protein
VKCQNITYISDMSSAAQSLPELILSQVVRKPEGALVSAREFLHLGSRAAIDKALSRFARSKHLMRAGWGLYILPVETKFGLSAPSPEKVVAQLAATNAETIAPHGAAAANKLGLTTQVPAKTIYYTSGPNRRIKLGAQTVELKHAPHWMLLGPGHAGEAVRALAWIGKEGAAHALAKLKAKLPESELHELVTLRSSFPSWLSESVSQALKPNV